MIIYFSPVPWKSIVQRPHRFFNWLSHQDWAREVKPIWVEPYPTRLPRPDDWARLIRGFISPPLLQPPEMLITPSAPPLEPIRMLRPLVGLSLAPTLSQLRAMQPKAVVIGKPSLLAQSFIRDLPEGTPVLLDLMDDLSAFHRGRSAVWMEHLVKDAMERCDEIWVSSSGLQTKVHKSAPGKSIRLVRNGVDVKRTLSFRYCWQIRKRPTVAGYIGSIAQWFDWDAMIQAALQAPSVEFRLYGPIESRRQIPSHRPSNLSLMGPIRPSDVPAILGEFDLGLIPFKINRLTESIDPIKYYEYRAAGLGVASTPFGDMRARGASEGVFNLGGPSWLTNAHAETIARRSRPEAWQSEALLTEWDRQFSEAQMEQWLNRPS